MVHSDRQQGGSGATGVVLMEEGGGPVSMAGAKQNAWLGGRSSGEKPPETGKTVRGGHLAAAGLTRRLSGGGRGVDSPTLFVPSAQVAAATTKKRFFWTSTPIDYKRTISIRVCKNRPSFFHMAP